MQRVCGLWVPSGGLGAGVRSGGAGSKGYGVRSGGL